LRILLGIGNPGIKYNLTWHNVGFIILDRLAEQLNIHFKPSKHDYYFAEGSIQDNDFILIKPTTYVNNSGLAALQIIEKYTVQLEDFLVVCDDLNIPKGEIKIKQSGGDGGHNGLASIIYHLNSNKFPRLRFGIGNGFDKGDMAKYVLSKISLKDFELIDKNLNLSIVLLTDFILGGMKNMLNCYSKNNNKLKND
jgi:PTH1 family peptidyl-tRNA hydrolase